MQVSLQRQEEGEIFVPGQEPQTLKIIFPIKEVSRGGGGLTDSKKILS
jgi:hypothetical protein